MDWRIFIAGVIVGWLIELAIDWFYWRRPQAEAVTATDAVTLDENRSQLQTANVRTQQLESDLGTTRAETERLQAELEVCWAELSNAQAEVAGYQTCAENLAAAQVEIERLRGEVTRLQPVEPDNLKRIEGIGPKIEGILNDAGILTFRQLATTEIARLQTILSEAGERYRLADPSGWPEQARLAADEKWDELSRLQDELKGGRR